MRTANYKLLLLAFLLFLRTNFFCYSQSETYPFTEWVRELKDKDGPVNSGMTDVLSFLENKDSSTAAYILNELEKKGNSAGKYFQPRFLWLKASWLWNTRYCAAHEQISDLMKKGINEAYETNNDSLVSAMSWNYSAIMRQCKIMEPAAMYSLFAAELEEKSGITTHPDKFILLGDILYNTRDYEKAIYYTRLAIYPEKETIPDFKGINMSLYNTIGLCWQKMENYDSAFHYFGMALKLAREMNNKVWEGIIIGNMGQIYFAQKKYGIAKELLEFDYRESKAFGELASAANSLQWIARIHLIEGKKDSAMLLVKEALQLLRKMPDITYEPNVYYTAAEVYRTAGNNDSAYKYLRLYNHLHDSLERAIAVSRLEIARIRLDNLQHTQAFKNLQSEKEAEELKRNLVIVFIILIAVIGFLILNRQKQKLRFKQQLALHQKEAVEKEIIAARHQMNLFRQSIVDKTNLIEKLQQQALNKEINLEQQKIIDELSQQTILTENDWDEFKKLFEKIYPGFFINLKVKAADITLAEQRMAALTRLHLTTRQIASMLGISVDSVHKSRQRLRQRLHIDSETNLEEKITSL